MEIKYVLRCTTKAENSDIICDISPLSTFCFSTLFQYSTFYLFVSVPAVGNLTWQFYIIPLKQDILFFYDYSVTVKAFLLLYCVISIFTFNKTKGYIIFEVYLSCSCYNSIKVKKINYLTFIRAILM
jgi:hypothetical protein